MMHLIRLLRPSHWLKNSLIFAPMFFSFSFTLWALERAGLAFIAFSAIASSVYIINDIYDRPSDRLHPEKKHRPLASGQVSLRQALGLLLGCLILGFGVALLLGWQFVAGVTLYFILNLAYSVRLKHLPIVDVMIIALGFVLRVLAGATAIAVPLSRWLILCTFFLALLLAFGKRKNEMLLIDSKYTRRKSIQEYTEGFIDQMISLSAGIALVLYILFTFDPTTIKHYGSDNLVYTTPIVVFIIYRYLYLLYNKNQGGDPVQIFLRDRTTIIGIFIWVLTVLAIYWQGRLG